MNAELQKTPVFRETALVEAIQGGLPLAARPYAVLGKRLGLSETQVIEAIKKLLTDGVIKRFGVIVRHRALGYSANAMVVWDIPDEQADAFGRRFSAFEFVTLCYRRPRRPPAWPYNLFCMIHGRNRDEVRTYLGRLVEDSGAGRIPHEVLFSRRCFKQRGAHYAGLTGQAS